jgi:hypothetical protein
MQVALQLSVVVLLACLQQVQLVYLVGYSNDRD